MSLTAYFPAESSHSFSPKSSVHDFILTLFFPSQCGICAENVESRDDGRVCRKCWESTRIFSGTETLCGKCGLFLKNSAPTQKTYCHRCTDDFFDQAVAAGFYERALLISILKLKHIPFVPRTLGEIITAAALRLEPESETVIIPVPLSERRRRERGFNQSELLARFVASKLGLSLNLTSLKRVSQIKMSRAGMDRKSRHESVGKAFQVTGPKLIEGRSILLIDDVFTSGATVSSCAKVLKEAGAKSVMVLTAARAG